MSQDLVFVKISLIRTAYAKGKWSEADGELIRLMNTFALTFPPKVEIAGGSNFLS